MILIFQNLPLSVIAFSPYSLGQESLVWHPWVPMVPTLFWHLPSVQSLVGFLSRRGLIAHWTSDWLCRCLILLLCRSGCQHRTRILNNKFVLKATLLTEILSEMLNNYYYLCKITLPDFVWLAHFMWHPFFLVVPITLCWNSSDTPRLQKIENCWSRLLRSFIMFWSPSCLYS